MDNNIIKRVSNGIWITNLNGFEIKSNAITNLSVLGSSVMQNGILAEGSRGGGYNIGIWSNFVQASSLYDWFQSGIRLETTVSTVAYNTVQDIGRGLFFGSVCTGTETAKNNMINNYSGIFLNWGVIGAQLSGQRATENSWHGTFPESHLFSLSSNGSQSPMYVYKTIPQCDPTLAPCTDPVNIRSVFSGSGAVQIPVFESTIVSGYKMSDPKRELYLKIAKDEFHFPMYDASARWMSKYNVYNKLQAEDSIYKVDEPELKWFADSVTASTMGELHKAAKELANNNDNSLTILNSVAPGNIVEQNLKDVYELVLSGRSNGNSFSKAQIKKLQSIAAQCPYEGGYGVYCARVLLAPLDNRVYNICESGRITKSGLKLAPSDTSMINNIMVYPNPANDILNVAIHLEDGQTGVLTVYDLTGKIALSSMLTNSNISEISTALLSEGLYIYKIIVNDIPLSTGKLSIIR
ncbi:MAG: T9SS type A sorting domain-containing protein [Bacteroidia bacterium]|nr:T9SS type A sorting domain-containing protein [Bacteroidia bacterium]